MGSQLFEQVHFRNVNVIVSKQIVVVLKLNFILLRFLYRMIKIDKTYIAYICFSLLCFYGCDKEESDIPTYLKLLPAKIEVTGNQGSANQNIEDYWLYIGSDLLGVFHPGQSVPVIGFETKDISIQPGIRTNGLRDNAYIYPFLENYRTQVQLCACSDTIQVQPVFKYKPTAKFSFTEDFESNNIFTRDVDNNPSTSGTVQSTVVSDGTFSLALNVDATNRTNTISSELFYEDFASDGRDVYLEFNYKSDFSFGIGIEANISGSSPVFPFGVYESTEWKKMYINLTEVVLSSKANGYRMVFSVVHPGGTAAPGFLYLDNIKLVHY